MAREDDGGGATNAPQLDAGFFRVKAQPSRVPSALAAHDLGVGQLRQRPNVRGVQVPEGSRGIVEMHPIGTLGSDRTEAAHPYIASYIQPILDMFCFLRPCAGFLLWRLHPFFPAMPLF